MYTLFIRKQKHSHNGHFNLAVFQLPTETCDLQGHTLTFKNRVSHI